MHPALRLIGFITALGAVGPLAVPATAQPYPSRLVKIVAPQTPAARPMSCAQDRHDSVSGGDSRLSSKTAPAAGGVLGTDSVAKSAPDGYTLLVTYAGSQAINASLLPQNSFDSVMRIFKPSQRLPSPLYSHRESKAARPKTLRNSSHLPRPSRVV